MRIRCTFGPVGPSSTTRAVPTARHPRSLRRFRVGAVAGLVLATAIALLPSAPAFGSGIRRPDPPLHAAQAVSQTGATKPALSKQPSDYIPATINGSAVVIDPRSTAGVHTDPQCPIPPEGGVFIPLSSPAEAAQDVEAGLWQCPDGGVPTGFAAGLDAVQARPTVPRLSEQWLTKPEVGATPGTVKTTRVKIGGKRLKVFVFQSQAAPPATPVGTTFENASVEVRPHLLLTVTTPSGTEPVPYLTAMLKAGAGKTPRAG
jgi:hypothetical protein